MVKGKYIYLSLIALALLTVIYIQWTKIGALKLENGEFDLKVEQLEKERDNIAKQVKVYELTLDSLEAKYDSLKSTYNEIPSDKETVPAVVITGNNSWSDVTGVLEVNGDTIH